MINSSKSLYAESTVPVPHPWHNKYINYYNHGRDEKIKRSDITPVYCPSQMYVFYSMRRKVELEDHVTEEEEIPPCTMFIEDPSEAVRDSLLSICSEISKYQAVTDLQMWQVTCYSTSLIPPRLSNPVSVSLRFCEAPDNFIEKILRQLFGCGESLQRLGLLYMNLAPFESLLDELLKDLDVSSREEERGRFSSEEAGARHKRIPILGQTDQFI